MVTLMIVLGTMQSFFCKAYSDEYPGQPDRSSSVFSVVSGLFIAFAGLILTGFQISVSPITVWLALLNAVVVFFFNLFMVSASKSGPYSVQMTFMLSGGILIPAFVSKFFFHDELSLVQWISVAIIVIAIALVSYKSGDNAIRNKWFWVFCVGLFVTNGFYGMLLDIQQRKSGAGEKEEMAMITYLGVFLLAFVFAAIHRRKNFFRDFRQTKKSLIFLLLCSFVTAAAIMVMLHTLSRMDTTIVYTFDNAGVLLFSVLCSAIFLREKMSAVNIVGCALMIGGLICVSAF